MKQIMILVIFLLLFVSCRKKDADKVTGTFVVQGWAFMSTDSVPAPLNTKVEVIYEIQQGFMGGAGLKKVAGIGTTDTNGYFEFLCNSYGEWYSSKGYYIFEDMRIIEMYERKDGVVNLDTIYYTWR